MKYYYTLLLMLFTISIKAQVAGIGIDNPTRAKLEVWGVAGAGKTSALFGAQQGISLQRSYPGIGFNQYLDNTTYGRYMGNGYAASWQFRHDDATLATGLTLYMYPSGTADAAIGSANPVWQFTRNNRFKIQSNGAGGSAELDVGRGTGTEGTAMFMGTTYHSHFCYAGSEHTYIRGGRIGSHVYINDITGGKVLLGNGSSTVGVNTNNYIPPTTLEVRQSSGGIKMINTPNPSLAWEMRVNQSPSDLYLYYAGSLKTWFSHIDGSMNAVSDGRLKEHVKDLTPVLEKMLLLRPVNYDMKAGSAGRNYIGFLAQDVQPLFPELVAENMGEQQNLIGVNYAGFNVIAVKAIQEEQAQVELLEKSLATMEERMVRIEMKIKQAAAKN
jgi:hypothetical protein